MQSGERAEFKLRDETAISFEAQYSSGKSLRSKEMYFSSRAKIIADISDNEIAVKYEFRT